MASESALFLAALRSLPPSTPVPTCPGWSAADLLWHLAEVQLFWTAVVRDRAADPERAEAAAPTRPKSFDDLLALAERASGELSTVLGRTAPTTPVWTWWHQDRTAAAVARRMAHEALIHRLDAEAITGEYTAVDRRLADDGVDEVLMVFHAQAPAWAEVVSSEHTGRLTCTDTDNSWDVTPGRWAGTSPDTGRVWDEPLLLIDPLAGAAQPAFTVRGAARDLDAWLWGRPPTGTIAQQGDPAGLALVTEVIDQGID